MLYVETRILSSLEKVFPTEAPAPLTEELTYLQDEMGAFQVACLPEAVGRFARLTGKVTVESDLNATVHQVGLVGVGLPCYVNDGRFLKDEPGLYPDPLMSADEGVYQLPTNRWTSFFVQFDTKDAKPGIHTVTVTFTPEGDGDQWYSGFSVSQNVEVLAAKLPKQKLVYTAWFHSDCLATYYNVPVFSDEYWDIVKKQAAAAAKYGQNMILVPMFTPPLDTEIGGERPTVQTVDVTLTNGQYSFDFSNFDKWIKMAQEVGFEYFELSHLFTQWGATSCPKVMATVDGEYKRIFGWDVSSTSDEYIAFLNAFLPTLIKHVEALGLKDYTYFHLTDEPHGDHLEQYLRLKNIVKPLIGDYPIMDAMSDYDYFYQGVSQVPAVATSALKPFLEGKRPENFWVYYCCGQSTNFLSNRMIAMPGYRTRMLGLQMYEEDVDGFLQWGLNFYYCRQSRHLIDPFLVTDGEYAWPSGDPFVLYPGKDGSPIISQRLVHFNDGLQDQRALQLLESLTSRDYAKEVIRNLAGYDIEFNKYPTGEAFMLKLRNTINREIVKASN